MYQTRDEFDIQEKPDFNLDLITDEYARNVVSTVSRTNSIDRYIVNGYRLPDISDSEYLSDDSFKAFIKKLDETKE